MLQQRYNVGMDGAVILFQAYKSSMCYFSDIDWWIFLFFFETRRRRLLEKGAS